MRRKRLLPVEVNLVWKCAGGLCDGAGMGARCTTSVLASMVLINQSCSLLLKPHTLLTVRLY